MAGKIIGAKVIARVDFFNHSGVRYAFGWRIQELHSTKGWHKPFLIGRGRFPYGAIIGGFHAREPAVTLKVFAHHTPWRQGLEVAIALIENNEVVGTVEPLAIKRAPHDPAIMLMPTLSGPLAAEFLQSALETAWEMGLRPKNWRLETPEQIKAMDAHLQDMRRIVFGRPPVKSMSDIISEMKETADEH